MGLMVAFTAVLGLLTLAIGLFGLAAPQRLGALVAHVRFTEGLRYLAAYARFLIAIILFFAAYQMRFGVAVQVLAVLTAIAGLVPLLVSMETLKQWFERAALWPASALRGSGGAAAALGAFLVIAAA